MGTYLNWIIRASDKDSVTTEAPLSDETNAHNHIKRPTHQNLLKTMIWRLYNKPDETCIHAINVMEKDDYYARSAYAVQTIMRFDENPVFINVHDNDDDLINKFGVLNMFTKWPPFIKVTSLFYEEWLNSLDNDMDKAAQWIYENWDTFAVHNGPIKKEEIMFNLSKQNQWLEIRMEAGPGEVLASDYHIPQKLPDHLIDICLTDIMKDDFIDQFEKIIVATDSGDYDFSYAREYHQTFVQAQKNMKFFECAEQLQSDGTINSWWNTNAMTKALLMMEKDKCALH